MKVTKKREIPPSRKKEPEIVKESQLIGRVIKVSLVIMAIMGLVVFGIWWESSTSKESPATSKGEEGSQRQAGARGAGVTPGPTIVRMEAVPVDVPYGRDDSGREIYSEPVEVTEGYFSYAFHGSDPGTGCLKVKINGTLRGESCAGHYLDLAMTDGGGKRVKIQFHGGGRPMKLVVSRPMP